MVSNKKKKKSNNNNNNKMRKGVAFRDGGGRGGGGRVDRMSLKSGGRAGNISLSIEQVTHTYTHTQ